MPFRITYEPMNRIRGVQPSSAEFATAYDAWMAVDGLQMSDENVTSITTPDGRIISPQELKALAKPSAH